MLSYRITGNGPALLLIHGWGVTWSVWRYLEPDLSRHAQLIQIELPGMGDSPRPEQPFMLACVDSIVEVREALGIAHWTVLAYSAGAGIATRYIRQDAAHVDGTIFLCPLLPLGGWRVVHAVAHAIDRRLPRLVIWFIAGWRLRALVRSALGSDAPNESHAEEWYREISSQPPDLLADHLREVFDKDWANLPPALPTLRIWGDRDPLATLPRRRLPYDHTIAAGHDAPLVSAPAVVREILAFLQAYALPGRADHTAGDSTPDRMDALSAPADVRRAAQ